MDTRTQLPASIIDCLTPPTTLIMGVNDRQCELFVDAVTELLQDAIRGVVIPGPRQRPPIDPKTIADRLYESGVKPNHIVGDRQLAEEIVRYSHGWRFSDLPMDPGAFEVIRVRLTALNHF